MSKSAVSRQRLYIAGTISVCVIRSRSASARKAAALNSGRMTSVPAQAAIARILATMPVTWASGTAANRTVGLGQCEAILEDESRTDQAQMRQHRALGASRGAGGVENDGGVFFTTAGPAVKACARVKACQCCVASGNEPASPPTTMRARTPVIWPAAGSAAPARLRGSAARRRSRRAQRQSPAFGSEC